MIDIEKIYNLYFKDVYYFVLSFSKNEDIARDITSETFFKILKSKDNIKDESSVKSYIFSVAKNSFIDYLRKNKIEFLDIDKISVLLDNNNPEELYLKNEEDREIHIALSQLDDLERNIVKFRIYENLSYKEIGSIYGKSENWACVKFYRAKNKLKIFLEDYYE